MSVEELSACIQGLCRRSPSPCCSKMVPPDNRCCFCLELRTGVIIIGAVQFVFCHLAFLWYVGISQIHSGFTTTLDISILSMFLIQVVVNLVLVFGAVKKAPVYTLPWLMANVVLILLLMALIFMLVFFGGARSSLHYKMYISTLTLLAFLAGTDLFCSIVVFQFRQNLLLEARIEAVQVINDETGGLTAALTSGLATTPSCPPATISQPPSYDLANTPVDRKLELDQEPPDYETAVGMQQGGGGNGGGTPGQGDGNGPVQRKKSLTNQHV